VEAHARRDDAKDLKKVFKGRESKTDPGSRKKLSWPPNHDTGKQKANWEEDFLGKEKG